MSPRVRKAKAAAEEEKRGEVTFEEIALRAYEIHLSGEGGDDVENWIRAEEQLQAELQGIHAVPDVHVAA
jgi:hypothetical protein